MEQKLHQLEPLLHVLDMNCNTSVMEPRKGGKALRLRTSVPGFLCIIHTTAHMKQFVTQVIERGAHSVY